MGKSVWVKDTYQTKRFSLKELPSIDKKREGKVAKNMGIP